MKKIACLVLSFCFMTFQVFAQTINVKSSDGSVDVIYSNPDDLQKAINEAPAGSTIALSGGTFNVGQTSLTISKEIHIVGAGIIADSTTVTGTTVVNGNISLDKNSDNSSIEAFELSGRIIYTANINNLTLRKLTFSTLIYPETVSPKISNIMIFECVFFSAFLNFAKNAFISNCILTQIIALNGYASIENNVFLKDTDVAGLWTVMNNY